MYFLLYFMFTQMREFEAGLLNMHFSEHMLLNLQ